MRSDDSTRGDNAHFRQIGLGQFITVMCARCQTRTECQRFRWMGGLNMLCKRKCIPELKQAREQRKQEAKA